MLEFILPQMTKSVTQHIPSLFASSPSTPDNRAPVAYNPLLPLWADIGVPNALMVPRITYQTHANFYSQMKSLNGSQVILAKVSSDETRFLTASEKRSFHEALRMSVRVRSPGRRSER